MSKKKNEIQKSEEHLPTKYDFGDDANLGRQNEDGEERTIPRVILIQSNSPQVAERKALPGQLYNLSTGEAIDAPIAIVPAGQDRWFIEKDKDRNKVGKYRVTDPKIMKLRREQGKFGKLYTNPEQGEQNSNYIQEERLLFYVFVHENGTFSRAVTPFKSSSGLPAWSAWKECIGRFEESAWQLGELPKGQKIPYPALLTTLGVKDDSGPKGQFMSFDFNPGVKSDQYGSLILTPDDERYQAAKVMAEALDDGAIEAADEAPNTEVDDARESYA